MGWLNYPSLGGGSLGTIMDEEETEGDKNNGEKGDRLSHDCKSTVRFAICCHI